MARAERRLMRAMTIDEAKAKLEATLDELAAAGFHVWGWDDETIQLSAGVRGPSTACLARHPDPDPPATQPE
jgi:hypothetical protein